MILGAVDVWTEPAIKTETEVDLYMAGFPCQLFSFLGKQEGVMDTKGRGIAAEVCIMRIANLKPRALILENGVKARTSHGGKFWEVLTNQLRTLGYTLDDCTMDAICAGTPQTRNRVYLIGRKAVSYTHLTLPTICSV